MVRHIGGLDCLLETGDTEGASCSDSDESDLYGLEAMCPHTVPSEDYDIDSDDGDCILEMGDTEDASCSDSDESDLYGLEAMCTHTTTSELSFRDSRRPSFFRRACSTILFANEVHAAS